MTTIPHGGMFEGTEWLRVQREKAALRARVERNAPMVAVERARGTNGMTTGYARVALVWDINGRRRACRLECGHTSKNWWSDHSRRRCAACLSTVLAGPYRCTAHDDCREHPALGAACWNDSPGARPTAGDAIAARLVWRWT